MEQGQHSSGWKLFLDDDAFDMRRPDLTVENPQWRNAMGLPPVPLDTSCYGRWIIARSYDEAVGEIAKRGMPSFVSFDHDLGDGKDGMAVARFIVEHDLDNQSLPEGFAFEVHSGNPVGRVNIRELMAGYLREKAKGQEVTPKM